MTEAPMTTILNQITLVVTEVLKWGGSLMTFITGNPLLLAMAGLTLFGCAIMLVKSMLHNH